MKAILISIKPKYIADILNHKKTIEVRKSMPKCNLPIDVYIYCTKETQLVKYNNKYVSTDFFKGLECPPKTYNGKVVAKFTLNKVEEYHYAIQIDSKGALDYSFGKITLEKMCLNKEEIKQYLKGKTGYAWHISNLEIFDRPKELSEFKPFNNGMPQYKFTKNGCEYITLNKAPQSYMFIEIGE